MKILSIKKPVGIGPATPIIIRINTLAAVFKIKHFVLQGPSKVVF
jgi:hypothetical protein